MTFPRRTAESRLTVLLVTLAAIFSGACQSDGPPKIAETGVVRIGTDATFPPFESHDPASGEVVGFDVDLARDLFGMLNYEVEFDIVPLDGLIPGLNRNDFDCILSAYTMTAERHEQVLFSAPYFETGMAILTRTDDSAVTGIADLVGTRIGVQLGSTGERLAKRIFRAEVFSYDSIIQAFGALEAGAVHAVLNDHPTSALYIAGGGPAKIVGGLVERERYAAAFRKSDGSLKERFDSALTVFMAGPKYAHLLLRYQLRTEAWP
jgi:glutamine transport system substrate-binding protein